MTLQELLAANASEAGLTSSEITEFLDSGLVRVDDPSVNKEDLSQLMEIIHLRLNAGDSVIADYFYNLDSPITKFLNILILCNCLNSRANLKSENYYNLMSQLFEKVFKDLFEKESSEDYKNLLITTLIDDFKDPSSSRKLIDEVSKNPQFLLVVANFLKNSNDVENTRLVLSALEPIIKSNLRNAVTERGNLDVFNALKEIYSKIKDFDDDTEKKGCITLLKQFFDIILHYEDASYLVKLLNKNSDFADSIIFLMSELFIPKDTRPSEETSEEILSRFLNTLKSENFLKKISKNDEMLGDLFKLLQNCASKFSAQNLAILSIFATKLLSRDLFFEKAFEAIGQKYVSYILNSVSEEYTFAQISFEDLVHLCNAANKIGASSNIKNSFHCHLENKVYHGNEYEANKQLLSMFLSYSKHLETLAKLIKLFQLKSDHIINHPEKDWDKLTKVLIGFLVESLPYRCFKIENIPADLKYKQLEPFATKLCGQLNPIFLSLEQNPKLFEIFEKIAQDYTQHCVNQKIFGIAIIGVMANLCLQQRSDRYSVALTEAMRLLLLIELCREKAEIAAAATPGIMAEVANATLSTACQLLIDKRYIKGEDVIFPDFAPFLQDGTFAQLFKEIELEAPNIFALTPKELLEKISITPSCQPLLEAVCPYLIADFQERRTIALVIQQLREEDPTLIETPEAYKTKLLDWLMQDEITSNDLDKLLPNHLSLTNEEVGEIIFNPKPPEPLKALEEMIVPKVLINPSPNAKTAAHSNHHGHWYN